MRNLLVKEEKVYLKNMTHSEWRHLVKNEVDFKIITLRTNIHLKNDIRNSDLPQLTRPTEIVL